MEVMSEKDLVEFFREILKVYLETGGKIKQNT